MVPAGSERLAEFAVRRRGRRPVPAPTGAATTAARVCDAFLQQGDRSLEVAGGPERAADLTVQQPDRQRVSE